MTDAKIIPLIYEYEVESELYREFREYNFFDFYTTLLTLRDIHSACLIYHENLNDELRRQRLEQEALDELNDDFGDDDEYENDPMEKDEEDYWDDGEDGYDWDDIE